MINRIIACSEPSILPGVLLDLIGLSSRDLLSSPVMLFEVDASMENKH